MAERTNLVELYSVRPIRTASGIIPKGMMFKAVPVDATKYLKQNLAMLASQYVEQPWDGLNWKDGAVAILASGPSMKPEVVTAVRAWREQAPDRKAIVINTTFRLFLDADVLYACDHQWWKAYIKEVKSNFKGDLWTQDKKAQKDHNINWIESKSEKGLNPRKGVINQGGNSGYQAIGLAVQAGAKKIYLFGFDMHGCHWHGPHPEKHLAKVNVYDTWLSFFPQMSEDLKVKQIEVINYTPNSALKVFPYRDIKELM